MCYVARGKAIDFNQEILALGLCNFAGCFFSSIPTSGSLCRTIVNASSGVKTPAGGILTGEFTAIAFEIWKQIMSFLKRFETALTVPLAFRVPYDLFSWKLNQFPFGPYSNSDILVVSIFGYWKFMFCEVMMNLSLQGPWCCWHWRC